MMARSRTSGAGSPASRWTLSALAIAIVLAGAAPAPARTLRIGFAEPRYQATAQAERESAFRLTIATGARIARIGVTWRLVAPAVRPDGFRPADPASPGYSFAQLDGAVRSAAARGLSPLLTLSSAPHWAEGPNRPRAAPEGSWRPSPAAFEAFARAVARRYSGGFPDPLRPGRHLPRVRRFQAWNEANISIYLTPQWAHGRPVSPRIFRLLVNALERGVHSVHRRNVVITGGTAPYGDRGHGPRMRPVRFLRAFFCLGAPAERCGPRPRFDVLAHHPINGRAPTISALSPGDASTSDIGRIRRVLRAAERQGRAGGARRHPIWATEIWWGSRPPARSGVPLRRQARWMEQALYLLWRQGVTRVVFLRLFDGSGAGQVDRGWASGVLRRRGRPKPAYRAVRFPLVGDRIGKRRVRVWGVAPKAGPVRVQRRGEGGWQTVRLLRARPGTPFGAVLRGAARMRLRAVSGRTRSLSWTVLAER